jgi:hypothetical protein
MKRLLLLPCFSAHIQFPKIAFDVVQCDVELTISIDEDNFAIVTLVNQQVAYTANILGGFSFAEKIHGEIDYKKYLRIEWPDDQSVPDLVFKVPPMSVCRQYQKGQKIELGIEEVTCYEVVYKDNVTAKFVRTDEQAYDFSFSTGFRGNLWKDPDGSHLIRFKGIRLDADEDGYTSESKFIISRSKYTNHLILILQDDATVYLKD